MGIMTRPQLRARPHPSKDKPMIRKIKNWFSPPVIVFRVAGGAADVKEFSNGDVVKHARKRFDVLIVNEAVTGIFFPKDGDNYGRK